MPTKPTILIRIFLLSFSLSLFTCTNPVSPEYQFIDGLLYIEGFVGTTEGSSFVKITKSEVAPNYRNVVIHNAYVNFVNADTGARFFLSQLNGGNDYLPYSSFKGEVGERWYLEVILPDDPNVYRSEIETIRPSVAVNELSFRYDKKLIYSEDYDRYVPGHEISISLDDPGDQIDYYYWRVKTYDKVRFCKVCYDGYYRGFINCNPQNYQPYYTYVCESDCWHIEFGNTIEVFSDKFSDGATTSSLPIANIILTRKTKILAEIHQFSITPKAYEYYRTIKDLINNNGGLNAPLPAALIGNMYNPDNLEQLVLGRFTAASATTKSIMIDRTLLAENPLEYQMDAMPEKENDPIPRPYQYTAPCENSRFRTSIRPEGWID